MALSDDIARIGALAAHHATAGEELAAVLVAEPQPGARLYLCGFTSATGRTWLALDDDAVPVHDRDRVREAVSIAALCELAEESSGVTEGREPRVASPEYLDELGGAASAVAPAVQQGLGAVEELAREVEARYKVALVDS